MLGYFAKRLSATESVQSTNVLPLDDVMIWA